MEFAEAFCNEVNAFLHTAQSIALGSNYVLFAQASRGTILSCNIVLLQ